MAEMKIGTVVRLKSGGPKMTVISVPSDKDEVLCKWFGAGTKDGKSLVEWFGIDTLDIAKDEEPDAFAV